MQILLILSLALFACSVGGQDANNGDFPYQLSLQAFGSHICSAAVISTSRALTAAHCTQGHSPSTLSVRAGSVEVDSGGTVVNVSNVIIHELYNPLTYDYDISILELDYSLPLGANIGVASLPAANSDPASGVTAIVTGWGSASPTLQYVALPTVSRVVCSVLYGLLSITDQMICAGFAGIGLNNAGQCDSGGPLTVNSTIVGIVSWGSACGLLHLPGVYTNVGALRSWIYTNSGI